MNDRGPERPAGGVPVPAADASEARTLSRADGPAGSHFHELIRTALAPFLRDVGGVALVGFPHHWNIGDSIIWAGSLQALRELGVPVRYVCTPKNYDASELRCHLPDGPVLLMGGGNFGDVYLDEVALRRHVLQDFRDRHVIQLPQSIWFRTAEGRDEVRRLVDAHPCVTLLLREQRSLDSARELFQASSLPCPDMALALQGRLPAAPAATRNIMGLKRGDVESLTGTIPTDGDDFADWPREEQAWRDGWSAAGRRAWDTVTHWHGAKAGDGDGLPMAEAIEASEMLARDRAQAGTALLCTGRAVVTDRLHAALLAWLAGRPAVLVDSVSGKSRATVETWFTGVTGMHAATNWSTGLELAARLSRGMPDS